MLSANALAGRSPSPEPIAKMPKVHRASNLQRAGVNRTDSSDSNTISKNTNYKNLETEFWTYSNLAVRKVLASDCVSLQVALADEQDLSYAVSANERVPDERNRIGELEQLTAGSQIWRVGDDDPCQI